jgi:general secretion pathway protein L
MTLVITRLPTLYAEEPSVWRITDDGQWLDCGPLAAFIADVADGPAMALVDPADARCTWSSLPDLEPRQAEGVARLQQGEQSIGLVHTASCHVGEDMVVTASIAPAVMQHGLDRLAAHGLNPDIVIPFGLAYEGDAEHVVRASFGGMAALRGLQFVVPDEAVFRNHLVRDVPVAELDEQSLRTMLLAAGERPLLNLREGQFAKRERTIWTTARQRKWLVRLLVAIVATTMLLGIVSWAKYRGATSAENERALAAAQKIDKSIIDIAQAEAQLSRALQQKGLSQGQFVPLSAVLWRSVQTAPNVSVRELRYAPDGIVVAVLAAPNSDAVNQALLAIQQDGYRVTATPRQDSSGATLVDLTMRMP